MKKKKVISAILLLALSISLLPTVFASEISKPDLTNIRNDENPLPVISSAEFSLPAEARQTKLVSDEELRNTYWSSYDFQEYYAQNPVSALEILNRAIIDYNTPITANAYLTTDEDVASVDAVLVKQPNGYTCGPTSAYMAIDGWDGTDQIKGSTSTAKINTLATQMGTAQGSGTNAYNILEIINTYVDNYNYKSKYGSKLGEYLFRVYTFNSLSYKRAPILAAETSALSYYNGHNTGHYITVTEFDYNTMEMRLNDPHNSSKYYGVHQVPYEEAYNAITSIKDKVYLYYWPE